MPQMLQVRLKDVIDYITGIVAQNAASSSIESRVPLSVMSAAAAMTAQAEIAHEEAAAQAGQSLSGPSNMTPSQLQHLEMRLDIIAEKIITSKVTQVLPWSSI